MFVSKAALTRRTVLRGVGAVIGLPFLEAMVPAFASAAAAPPPLRFGAVYIPNGSILGGTAFADQWTPATVGDLNLSPILQPLTPLRDRVVVVSNLRRSGENVHAVCSAAWLSSAVPKKTEAEDVRLGVTMDQLLARHIGQQTAFPSIELATEDFTGYVGGCSPGYSCAYMNTVSWSSPTTPLPMEINPRAVFERMFGRAGTEAQRRERMRRDRSLLDSVADEAARLRRSVGTGDRARLNDYLDQIREIEQRIQRTEATNAARAFAVDAPIGVPEHFAEHVAAMFDLMLIAYQADLTRVVTFMLARELSQRTYPELGITQGHHDLSHHGDQTEMIAAHARINAYHVELFTKFLTKLAATPDGDGSLLDHVLLAYGSGMGNGNSHGNDPLPFLAVGGGLGKGGRHVQAPPHTPLGSVWVGIGEKFGLELETVGETTGRVDL